MAIKMRYLYASGKKKFATIGEIIKQKFQLTVNNAVDVIPPAYPCDKERFVFIGITVKDEPENKVRLFCQQLDKTKAAKVALIVDGNEKGAQALKDMLTAAGTSVFPEVFFIKGGLPFLGSLNADEKKALDEWLDRAIQSL
jgi:hypothetical protein